MENFRLFIGLSLSDEVTSRLAAIMEQMSGRLPFRRWTHPADLHVTLHFLGDTPIERLDAIREATAVTAAETPPITLALTEPGTFGPAGAPRILWCGLAEQGAPGALAALHAALAPRLAAAGCALEARPYRAHVTLARQGGAGCGREAIASAWHEASADAGSLAWTALRVTLFRSHLGRRPSYERLDQFLLAGPAGP
ncbi:RNA 2',3'-cyclic phosphodiesterase [Cohnella pontilimi]|uniref:RNA 2',3'-cyclic phosphodiesterase n=1 Tax=Cohnella pontilimi TaxID=2564100 RepID=A0A4U0F906_9BACL|nr:RNA 2',3'-cyclic phosphodiesterase [Cohnella pontilimi]TJY41050.1 RNA 2',3'-cyclic phosphodiesterase [Cohnella pontilimi]